AEGGGPGPGERVDGAEIASGLEAGGGWGHGSSHSRSELVGSEGLVFFGAGRGGVTGSGLTRGRATSEGSDWGPGKRARSWGSCSAGTPVSTVVATRARPASVPSPSDSADLSSARWISGSKGSWASAPR